MGRAVSNRVDKIRSESRDGQRKERSNATYIFMTTLANLNNAMSLVDIYTTGIFLNMFPFVSHPYSIRKDDVAFSRMSFWAHSCGTKNEAHQAVTNLAPKAVPPTVCGTVLGAKFVTTRWASFWVPKKAASNRNLERV